LFLYLNKCISTKQLIINLIGKPSERILKTIEELSSDNVLQAVSAINFFTVESHRYKLLIIYIFSPVKLVLNIYPDLYEIDIDYFRDADSPGRL